jgi:hypothetical protein|eukprot:scaffold765_cov151-Chaetoceros_neogracile.AAC.7
MTSEDNFDQNPKVQLIPPMERFVKDWGATQVPVEIKGIFIRHIADVNTIDQSFKIAAGFDMMWPSTDTDIKSWTKDPISFTPEFVPNFEFPK